MLDNRMIIEVFFFLSVFDIWKSGKVIVVNSAMEVVSFTQSWESRRACVRVSCAVAGDIFWDYGAE
jgi:hypothetical protein